MATEPTDDQSASPQDRALKHFVLKKNSLDDWVVYAGSTKHFTHPIEGIARDWAETAEAHGTAAARRRFKASRHPRFRPPETTFRQFWDWCCNAFLFVVGAYFVW